MAHRDAETSDSHRTGSWLVDKEYVETGIRWKCSLRGSSRTWVAVTPWGDEAALEQSLIREWAAAIVGPIRDEMIEVTHACGKGDDGRWYGRERLSFASSGIAVSVWVKDEDHAAGLRELLAIAIRAKDRAYPPG